MLRRRTFLAGAIAGPLILAACGGDGGDGAAAIESGELPAPADGPVPDLPVDAAAESNRLPAIAVRQINGDGGWVQLKNYAPSERPILFWFYAPH